VLNQILVGPNGLRAGWRVLMFIALLAVLFGGFVLIRAGGPEAFREHYRNQNQSQITITPLLMGGAEAITLLFLCVAAMAMGKLEHRKFGEYGLPLRLALRKNKEQRTKNKEQRTKNKEQRTKNKEQRTKNRNRAYRKSGPETKTFGNPG
jgi:hypothetical protein